MKMKSVKLLSLALASTMVINSAATDVYAAGNDLTAVEETSVVQTEESMDAGQTSTVVEGTTETQTQDTEETSASDVTESDSTETVVEETEATVETETVEEETETVETEITETETKETEEDIWYTVPQGYTYSAEELELKEDMSNTLEGMDGLEEGRDYVEGQVFAFAETQAEAEMIADAYHADIVSFDAGIVVLELQPEVSVYEAVQLCTRESINMPLVYPDFYRYYDAEVPDYELVSETETEGMLVYSADDTGVDYDELEEEEKDAVYEVATQAYSDPYLKGSSSAYQWFHETIGSVYAWNAGYTGKGVKVGVIDSGVTKSHSDLSVASYQVMVSGAGESDSVGHGTHVSGIIAAKANGAGGVGVAPGVTLNVYKVSDRSGGVVDSAILSSISKAITDGVDVVNISIGGPEYTSAYEPYLKKAYKSGMAIFASAGNDGGQTDSYPASFDHVISVAATDKANGRANFSNYGPSVDICAPGVDIYSTYKDGEYYSMDGTSMACPVAVGEAAIILQANSSINSKTGKARVDALEKYMKANCISAKGSGIGKGIVSLPKALKLKVNTATPNAPVITTSVASNNQSATVTMTAQSGSTIYYTTDGSKPSYKNGVAVGTKYSGTITLKASGAAKYTVKAITVNAIGKASAVGSKTVTLKPYVTSIAITGSKKVAVGKSAQYKAELTPSFATNKKVTWSINSTDPQVKISKSGKLTVGKKAVTGKTYKITATSQDEKAASASFNVTITAADTVKSVKFTEKTIKAERKGSNVTVDLSKKLDAKDASEKALGVDSFTWKSSNTGIATVSSKGVVTIYKSGTVKITATATDSSKKSATVTIKVTQKMTSLGVASGTKQTITVSAGKSAQFSAAVSPSFTSNKKLKWSVDEGVTAIKVSQSGKVTTKKGTTGSYKVYAMSTDDTNLKVTYTVKVVDTAVKSIKAEKSSVIVFTKSSIHGGKADSINKITFEMTNNGTIAADAYTITNSAPELVTYTPPTSSGNVLNLSFKATGKGNGTATITVAAKDGSGKKASFKVIVGTPANAVKISVAKAGSSEVLAKGKSKKLRADIDSDGEVATKAVTWSISPANQGVTIAQNGIVKASSTATQGRYTVTATAKDGSGAKGTFTICVTEKCKSVSLRGISTNYIYYSYKGRTLAYRVDYNSDYDGWIGGVTVSSSNPKAISVTYSGGYVFVAFNNPGTANVTIKSSDECASKTYHFECR